MNPCFYALSDDLARFELLGIALSTLAACCAVATCCMLSSIAATANPQSLALIALLSRLHDEENVTRAHGWGAQEREEQAAENRASRNEAGLRQASVRQEQPRAC